jgi:uncharacterized Zn-binding protein involved in type VI secretion
MGKPAARMGDPTAHGGVIVSGFPTVLIGGMPAARLTDMHTCPMVTPGVPPVPHVGGPISGPGVPTVLIGGMPAVCAGDMAVCVGPPSTIIMGCPTVLIGAGGGGGGGGGAGSTGAASAKAGAAQAKSGGVESSTKEKNWLEMKFVDKAKNSVSGIHYKLKDTESKESKSILRTDGRILRDGIKEGEATATLVSLHGAKWSKEKAKVGDKVKLTVNAAGIEDNTKAEFSIFVKDVNYSDHLLRKLEVKTSGNKAETEWKIEVEEDYLKIVDKKEYTGKYSQPYFYFDVYCDEMRAKSPLLFVTDEIEITVKDDEGKAISEKEYKIKLPSGEIKTGKLDNKGKVKLEKLPPGKIKINLKN